MGVKVRQIPKGSGNWYVVVTHRGERRAQKMKDEDAAEKKAVWVRKRLDNLSDSGAFTPKKRKRGPMLGDYAEIWMNWVEANLAWNTQRYYADMLQRVPEEMKGRPLAEITRDDVRAMARGVLERKLSRATAAGLMRTISALYTQAFEDGVYRGANPALRPGRILREDTGEDVEDPTGTDCMTEAESRHFLEVVQEHFPTLYPVFLTPLRTGVREGENLALAWDAIDWNGGFIVIKQSVANGKIKKTKTRRVRKVPMSSFLAHVLQAHKKRITETMLAIGKPDCPWLFPSPTGDCAMDPSRLRKEFAKGLKKAGIRHLTLNSLRHTGLTMMAENGVPLVVLHKIAGHSKAETTSKYYLRVKPEYHDATISALEAIDGRAASASKMRAEGESCFDPA